MAGVLIHAIVYAVVNALLVGAWLVTGHTWDELNAVTDDPLQAVKDGFWPLYAIVGWGAALVIHVAIWLVLTVTGGPRRHRHRREQLAAQRAQRQAAHQAARLHGRHELPDPGLVPPIPAMPAMAAEPARMAESSHDLAKQATKAALGFVESLATRVATPRPSAEAKEAAGGREWVAVMFTDIVGSTDLTEALGDDVWMKLLGDHRSLVRDAIAEHHGAEVGTQGDGFLVRFATPGDAVSCATAIQRRLAVAREAGGMSVQVRIGIHAGEAVSEDGDLVGRVINLASRVTSAALPGEILVTEPVADHLPPRVLLTDRGLQTMKGIAQPRHLLAVAWGEGDRDDTTVLLDEERF